MPAFDITQSDQTVEHGLGTRDIIVQGWQNNYLIQPDVAMKSDDEIRIFAAGATEQNPIRLLVIPVETPKTRTRTTKSSKEKSSASSEEKPKRTRRTSKA